MNRNINLCGISEITCQLSKIYLCTQKFKLGLSHSRKKRWVFYLLHILPASGLSPRPPGSLAHLTLSYYPREIFFSKL